MRIEEIELEKVKRDIMAIICNDCTYGKGYCGKDCREIMLIRKFNKVVDVNKYNYYKKRLTKRK